MQRLRHRNGYYKGCYYDMDTKSKSLGETLTLKEVLDLWWNSVRVRTNGGTKMCWKNAYTCDNAYELDGLSKSTLKKLVEVENYYDYDCDGYPIVYCNLLN